MHKFEIKRSLRSNYFGNLQDLNANRSFLSKAFDFLYGNYVVFRSSSIDSNGRNFNSIVILHENVDAELVSKKLWTQAIEPKPDVTLWKMFTAQLLWTDYWRNLNVETYGQHFRECSLNDGWCNLAAAMRGGSGDGAKIEQWQLNLFELMYEAYESAGSLEEAKSFKFSHFFYFVNKNRWVDLMERNMTNLRVKMVEGLILEFKDEQEIIGFAINMGNALRSDQLQAAALQDDGSCYGLVLRYRVDDRLVSATRSVIWCRCDSVPMSELFYENEYRLFDKNGARQENLYYGAGIGNQSGFDRLPDNVLQQIFSYLPWRQRAQYRRVSQRWAIASDLALEADTKIVDYCDVKFRRMNAVDFDRLLPIVADQVQSITLSPYPGILNPEHLVAVSSFRSLREITFGQHEVSGDILISILDKCPNLKKLVVRMGIAFPKFNSDSPKVYQLEYLKLGLDLITDSNLMAIADCFPKLSCINLYGGIFCTNAILTTFAQRFGDNLKHLEIKADSDEVTPSEETVAFTGIGACSNLEYLSLSGGNWNVVCDDFINALTTGCVKLHTLFLENTRQLTNNHVSALATLPQLKRLNIGRTSAVTNGSEFSDGVKKMAIEGRLEQLLADGVEFSLVCLKALIRYCPGLKLLDGCDEMDIPVDDAVDIVRTYGRCGKAPYLVFRTRNGVWLNERVRLAQNEVKEGHFGQCRRFIIDYREEKVGFLGEDDEDYEGDADFYDVQDEDDDFSFNPFDIDQDDYYGGYPTSDDDYHYDHDYEHDDDDDDDDVYDNFVFSSCIY